MKFFSAETPVFPLLETLNLRNNQYDGAFPPNSMQSTITNMDLSYNYFTGFNTIHWECDSEALDCPKRFLDVSNNRLTPGSSSINGNGPNEQNPFNTMDAPMVLFYPQDVDDCLLGTFTCPPAGYCSNGWYPRNSYTCSCNPGYFMDNGTCVDIDECANGQSMNEIGLDGDSCDRRTCVNKPGNFTCCETGYETFNGTCRDINECAVNPGDKGPCNDTSTSKKCINTEGSYYCCAPGLEVKENGNCEDLNECLCSENHPLCGFSKLCINFVDNGYDCCTTDFISYNNTCVECFGEWYPSTNAVNTEYEEVKDVLGLDESISFFTDFGACTHCSGGTKSTVRDVLPGNYPDTPDVSLTRNLCRYWGPASRADSCSYPCLGQGAYNTASSAIIVLFEQLTKEIDAVSHQQFYQGFIQALWGGNAPLNITITGPSSPTPSGKRQSTSTPTNILIQWNNCSNNRVPGSVLSNFSALSHLIVPNAPKLAVTSTGCVIQISSNDTTGFSLVGLIVGVVLGFLALLVLLILLWRFLSKKEKSQLKLLPPEIAWSFKQAENHPKDFSFRGTDNLGYMFKTYPINSKEYNRVKSFLDKYLCVVEGNSSIDITNIIGVYNPLLVKNFIGSWTILQERIKSNPGVFNKQIWKKQNPAEDGPKQKCFNHYVQLASSYSWNLKDNNLVPVPIIPVCHGTDLPIAEKICETGFAALSSLDDGWYGKGIYFTSYALYTLPYIMMRRAPAIIISYIAPGNVFPVSEHRKSKDNLNGKPMSAGHNSHYVAVGRSGDVAAPNEPNIYNEIVVEQESQIMPAFLLEIDNTNFKKLFKKWTRVIPEAHQMIDGLRTEAEEPRPKSILIS